MERSVLDEEKHHEVCKLISNSSTSPIKIDSISIDLVNRNEKNEVGKCKHFSIRGFVAEIRKKDGKQCWPFHLDDKDNNSQEDIDKLPPLLAAKSRWWRCKNCIREIDPRGTADENKTTPNCCQHGNKSNCVCSHMPNSLGRSETDVNAYAIVNFDDNGVVSCIDKREKEITVKHNTLIDHEKSSKHDKNREFPRPTLDEKFNSCLKLGMHTVSLESISNELVETCKTSCSINEAACDALNHNSNLNFQNRKATSIDDQNTEVMTSGHPSPEFDTHDNEYSESDDILGENHPLIQQKPQKVRLLAELLFENGNKNKNSDDITLNDSPSSDSGSLDQVLYKQGNKGKSLKSEKRKREISFPNNEAKKSRILKEDVENNEIAISGSKYYSVGNSSQIGKNKFWNKNGVDRKSVLNKKSRKIRDNYPCSSLLPLQEVASRKYEKKVQNVDKRSSDNQYRVMDPELHPSQRIERKSSFQKNKYKSCNADNLQDFLMPWNNENLINGQNGSEDVQFQSLRDAPIGKGSYFNYRNYLSSHKNNKNSSVKVRPDCSLPMRESVSRENQFKRKDVGSSMYVGESSVPYNKSAADTFIGEEIRWDLNIKTGPNAKSVVSEKRIWPNLVEDGDFSTLHKMDIFGKSKKTEDVRKQGGLREERSFDQGPTDDIPMEIVELLAKNQYERRLNDAKKAPHLLEPTYKARNGEGIDVSKLRMNGKQKLSPEENPYSKKSLPGNTRKNTFMINEFVGPTNEKSGNNFPWVQSFPQYQHQKLSNGVQFNGNLPPVHAPSFPANFQAFKAYDPQQKPPGVWSSLIQNIPQSYEPQGSNRVTLSPHPNTLQKRKMKENSEMKYFDLNVPTHEKQNRNFGLETINGGFGEHPYAYNKVLGPVDMYSNETIPAMHLLSLMDPAMRSNAPFSVNEKTNYLKRSSFPQDHLFNLGHASKHGSSIDYRKNPIPEKSCECYSSVPAFGALTSSLQNDLSIIRATDFLGQDSREREKGKGKKSYSPTRNKIPKSHKSASKNIGFGINSKFTPLHSSGKMKHIEFESQNSQGSVWPSKKSSVTEICSVNRNPADFTIPGEGNMYMIHGKDLKFRKIKLSENKSGFININPQKKQRLHKVNTTKERI